MFLLLRTFTSHLGYWVGKRIHTDHTHIPESKVYSKPSQTFKMGSSCKNSLQLKAVNYFPKKLDLRCPTRFWIRLWLWLRYGCFKTLKQNIIHTFFFCFIVDFEQVNVNLVWSNIFCWCQQNLMISSKRWD